MGFLTLDGANYLLGLFGGTEPKVDTYYVALITGSRPGLTTHGVELEEPAFADYSRAQIAADSSGWDVDQGVLTNTLEIPFPIPTSLWGVVSYWAITDSAETGSGRVLWAGDCDNFTVNVAEQIFLPQGSLSLQMDLDSWQEVT